MVLFPEGTRYNIDLPQVIAKSQSFSETNGIIIEMTFLLKRDLASGVEMNVWAINNVKKLNRFIHRYTGDMTSDRYKRQKSNDKFRWPC